MANNNVYSDEPRYGRDVASLMRRINALESAVTFTDYRYETEGQWVTGGASVSGCNQVYTLNAMEDADGDIHVACQYDTGGFTPVKTSIRIYNASGTYDTEYAVRTSSTWARAFFLDEAADVAYVARGTISTITTIDKYTATTQAFISTVTLSSSVQASGQVLMVDSSGNFHIVGTRSGTKAVHVYNSSGTYQSSYAGTEIGGAATGRIYGPGASGRKILTGRNSTLNQNAWAFNSSNAQDGIYSSGVASVGYGGIDYANDRVIYRINSTFQAQAVATGTLHSTFPQTTPSYPSANESSGFVHSNGKFYYFYDAVVGTHDLIVQRYAIPTGVSQTAFRKYSILGVGTSLGTPDGGVNVPALDGIDPAAVHPLHIIDMRNAIESIAPYYENAATTSPWNFDDADDDDNLYYNAMGDRTDYGATGGALYTWTKGTFDIGGTPTHDIDIGEIAECVTLLEESDLT